jgi:hypothetical protein
MINRGDASVDFYGWIVSGDPTLWLTPMRVGPNSPTPSPSPSPTREEMEAAANDKMPHFLLRVFQPLASVF